MFQKRVITATSSNDDDWTCHNPDFLGLEKLLACQQVSLHAGDWDDPNISWEIYDMVILGGAHSYIHKYQQFNEWLDLLDRKKCHRFVFDLIC